MTLYSHHGARPTALPFRITLPSGFTRTDPTTFTPEEIAAAGFTGPYVEPPYDPATHQLNWDGTAFTVEPLPPPPPQPQWQAFAAALAADPAVNALVAAAAQQAPVLHLALGVGLGQAAQGDAATFSLAWSQALALGLASQELADAVDALAEQHGLPAAFRATLGARPAH